MHRLRMEDSEVSLKDNKEKGQSSTYPSYDSPGARKIGVQALPHPQFQFAIIATFQVLPNFDTHNFVSIEI